MITFLFFFFDSIYWHFTGIDTILRCDFFFCQTFFINLVVERWLNYWLRLLIGKQLADFVLNLSRACGGRLYPFSRVILNSIHLGLIIKVIFGRCSKSR